MNDNSRGEFVPGRRVQVIREGVLQYTTGSILSESEDESCITVEVLVFGRPTPIDIQRSALELIE